MQTSDAIFVPFRCPDCKEKRSFETLKELRDHLQKEHSDVYALSARKRQDSGLSSKGRRSPVLELFRADAVQLEENLKRFKESELNNKRQREAVSRHASSERLHDLPMAASSRTRGRYQKEDKASFRNYGHPSRVKYRYFQKQDVNRRFSAYGDSESGTADLLDEEFIDDSDPHGRFNAKVTQGKMKRGIRSTSSDRAPSVQRTFPAWRASNENLAFQKQLQSLGNELDSHVQETLSALSQEVVVGRSTQQATMDSLRTSQEIYSHLEHAAQERMIKQQEVIASLTMKLSEKEEQMADVLVEMNTLKMQHDEEIEVKNIINQKSTYEREKLLQEEISHKQKELESLSERLNIARQAVKQYRGEIKDRKEKDFKPNNDTGLSNTIDNLTKSDFKNKQPVDINDMNSHNDDDAALAPDVETNNEALSRYNSKLPSPPKANQISKEVTPKEMELARMRSKSKQLENDRQTLLLEMQTLLETAATDNEKLRMELTNQGKQLSKLNLELERSKQEQSELLGETNTLYFQADLSLTRLKQMLEDKDGQLSTVAGQLEHAKDMQNKLIKEREDYLKLAEEKESKYRSIVQENAHQLQAMKDSLNESQIEKTSLETKMLDLKKELQKKEQSDVQMEERLALMETQLSSHEHWQERMLEQINNKEERIQKAKNSMEKMNSFLSEAADKELETRSKLEQFIATLVDRSAQAEADLQKMKVAYAAKVKSLTDATLNSNDGVPFDWKRTPVKTRFADRQISDDVFFNNNNGNGNIGMDKYRNASVNKEPYSHASLPRRQMSSTEMARPREIGGDGMRYEQDNQERRVTPKRYSQLESSLTGAVSERPRRDRSPSKRKVKSRPLFIQGKELPSSASNIYQKRGKSQTRENDRRQLSKSLDNLHKEQARFDGRLSHTGLSKSYFGLNEPEISLYHVREDSMSQPRKISSSFDRKRQYDNKRLSSTSPELKYGLFRNTPEVNKMYRNVHKIVPGQNERHKKSQNGRNRRLSSEFIIDDDGIIWESFDYSQLMNRRLSSKSMENGLVPLDHQDVTYDHNSEHYSHDESEDERSPERLKKNKQNRTPSRSFVEGPQPLGDKIVKVLNSMESSPLHSAARRDYPEKMKNRTHFNASFNNDAKPLQVTTSDSVDSSPVHRAYEVQKRVERLTSPAIVRGDSPQPAPRTKGQPAPYQATTDDLTDGYSPRRSSRTSMPQRQLSYRVEDAADESDISVTSYASLNPDLNNRKSGTAKNSVSWFDDEDRKAVDVNRIDNVARSNSVTQLQSAAQSMNEAQSEDVQSSQIDSQWENDNDRMLANGAPLTKTKSEERADSLIDTTHEECDGELGPSSIHLPTPNDISQTNEEEDRWSEHEQSFDYGNASETGSESEQHFRRQGSLQRRDSQPSPSSSKQYDLVLKELIKKHPYLETPQQDQEDDIEESHMPVTQDSFDVNRDESRDEDLQEESTDYGMLSSDEDAEATTIHDEARSMVQKAKSVESIDASTDTDLEKLAMPGYNIRRNNAIKKKKHPLGRRSDYARSKRKGGHSDPANWTSTDTNDFEEMDQDERLTKRRRRVALFCVLNYVDTETLLVASQVCREWRKISHHPALWKRVVLKDARIGSEFLVTMAQWCTQTESLSLTGLMCRSHRLMESEEDYQTATRGALESGLDRLLFACQGTLKSLTIERCENVLTDKCLWLISGNCRMLTSLCYRNADHPATPQLLWALGGGCPGVTTLRIQPVPGGIQSGAMNNRFLLLIGKFYRDLQEVGLGGKEFDMAGLIPMIQSCQRLKVIHLDCCMTLTDDVATAMCRVGLKDLETLTVDGTGVQAKALQTLQKNCRHLRKISLSVTAADFGLDASKKKDKDAYKKSVQALKDLRKKAGFSNILTVEADEV